MNNLNNANRVNPAVNNGINTQKTLWEQYGRIILVGVFLVFAAIAIWQWMSSSKEKEIIEASKRYDTMVKAFLKKDLALANTEAERLQEKYADTPYAAFAALVQGRMRVDQNDLAKAEEHFKDAMELGADGPASHIARVRLARVLASENKLDEALKLLSVQDNEGYVALYEETKGDIYALQKNYEKARESYKMAEQALPPGMQVMALQLKQADVNQGSDAQVKSQPLNQSSNANANANSNSNNSPSAQKSEEERVKK